MKTKPSTLCLTLVFVNILGLIFDKSPELIRLDTMGFTVFLATFLICLAIERLDKSQ